MLPARKEAEAQLGKRVFRGTPVGQGSVFSFSTTAIEAFQHKLSAVVLVLLHQSDVHCFSLLEGRPSARCIELFLRRQIVQYSSAAESTRPAGKMHSALESTGGNGM